MYGTNTPQATKLRFYLTQLHVQGSQGQLDKEEELRYRMHQGRPHLFTDMRITNDKGHEMPHDGKATGELEVRGPHVVKAYFRVTPPPLPILYYEVYTACMQSEVPRLKDRLTPTQNAIRLYLDNQTVSWCLQHKESSAVDAEGWFKTGDVASIDPLGFMRITDRSKDVIKSGGEWISSIDIENAAMSHHHVSHSFVPSPCRTHQPGVTVAIHSVTVWLFTNE